MYHLRHYKMALCGYKTSTFQEILCSDHKKKAELEYLDIAQANLYVVWKVVEETLVTTKHSNEVILSRVLSPDNFGTTR